MFKRVVLSSVSLFIFAGLALAKGKPGSEDPVGLDCDVFVSSYAGGQIQCVKIDGSKTKVTTIYSDLGGTFSPEDMTLGPDKHLYVANTDFGEVIRINGDAGSSDFLTAQTIYSSAVLASPPFDYPQGPSFHQDDLYISSEEGVFRFAGVAGIAFGDPVGTPEQIVDDGFGTGEGTDFRVPGQILVVDSDADKVVSAGPDFDDPVVDAIVGFGFPLGIAVSPNDDVFVADNGNQNVVRCDAAEIAAGLLDVSDSDCTVIKTFYGTDAPYFIEHDFNGNLWVATEDEDLMGKIWKIQNASSVSPTTTLIANLDDFDTNGNKPGAIKTSRAQGLALPLTGTSCGLLSGSNIFALGTLNKATFDCASYQVKVAFAAAETCTLGVRVDQTFPGDLAQQFSDSGLDGYVAFADDYSPFGAVFTDSGCEDDDKDITIFYFKFSETEDESPVTDDFPGLLEKNAMGDWEDVTTAYYSGGPIPDDAGRRGGSRSVLTLADGDVFGISDGFRPPMDDCPDCVFNLGSTVPVKFSILEDGVPVTDAVPLISVQCVENGNLIIPFSNPNIDNIARLAPGQQYIYNLQLLEPDFGTANCDDQVYRLIVIDKVYLAPQEVRFTVKD